ILSNETSNAIDQATEQGERDDNTDDHGASSACVHGKAPDTPYDPDIPNETTDSKVRIVFRDNPSITDRLREAIKPTPVKRRIQFAAYKLRTQTNRLEKTINQMEHRDRILHDKCVKALEVRDTQSATLFANECVQIRKLIKTSLSSQISLEQVLLRLETVEEFGDMVHSMGSVRGILSSVKNELEGKLPEISTGIHDIEDSLENLTTEIGEVVDA